MTSARASNQGQTGVAADLRQRQGIEAGGEVAHGAVVDVRALQLLQVMAPEALSALAAV